MDSERPAPTQDADGTEFVPVPVHGVELDRMRADVREGLFGSTTPSEVGRYTVLRSVGKGGMGLVLAAYDPDLDRKVALKFLRGGPSKDARSRLLREAQAIAKVSHPNVIHVYEAGTHADDVYLAMEYVEGDTLRKWLDQGGHSVRAILDVFVQAGRGLSAAHAVGLAHRDFKPQNVLIGRDGRVRVLDFGIARAVGESVPASDVEVVSVTGDETESLLASDMTRTGVVLGTPAFMSPEQHRGEPASAHGDQYGFCVSLFEALWGYRPFSGTPAELASAKEAGLSSIPPRGSVPRTVASAVVRGLAPDPEQRWPTMDALIAVLARDAAAARNRWLAVGFGAATLATFGYALGGGSDRCSGADEQLTGVWGTIERDAVRSALLATGVSYAESTSDRIRERLDGYADRWVLAHRSACEASVRGEQSTDVLDLRMACLQDRRAELRSLVEVLEEADEKVAQGAVSAVSSLSELERCADVDALHARLPPPQNLEVAGAVADERERLARAYALSIAGKYSPAIELAESVLKRAEVLDYGPLTVEARQRIGEMHRLSASYDRASDELERAYYEALELGHDEVAIRAAAGLAWTLGLHRAEPRFGLIWARHGAALAHRAVPQTATEAAALDALGLVRWAQGGFGDARMYYERALAIRTHALGADHPKLATSFNLLANAAMEQGAYDEAQRYYQRCLDLRVEALGPDHPFVGNAVTNLGNSLLAQGSVELAHEYYERALVIGTRALREDHPNLGDAYNNAGRTHYELGRLDTAIEYLERGLELRVRANGPDHPDVASSLSNLAILLVKDGRLAQAEAYAERSLALKARKLGRDHTHVAFSHEVLGGVLTKLGQYAEAKRHHERALTIRLVELGPDHDLVADSLLAVGQNLGHLKHFDEAVAYLERAVGSFERSVTRPTNVARAQMALAEVLSERAGPEDLGRARSLAERARDTYASSGAVGVEWARHAEEWLARH